MMKKKLSYLLSLLLLTISVNVFADVADFAIKEGKQSYRLSDLKGKVVYLDFWASWCGPCRTSFPFMNALQAKYGKDKLVVIAVNVDAERQLAEQFLAKIPANFTVVYDPQGDIAKQYQLLGMPSSFIIDKTGQLVYQHTGFFEQKIPQYQQEIDTLIQASK